MKYLKRIYKRFVAPVIQLHPSRIRDFAHYLRDARRYRTMGGVLDSYWPVLGENTKTTSVDPHYFYQGIWAAAHIARHKPVSHVDVGSQTDFVGYVTTVAPVTSVEIRPLKVELENFTSVLGSILAIPMPDDSVRSLSCLHVAEHIGLGRYGDPLDPKGTEKACAELARILAPEGHLYFSVPIGRERTEFNAHRIHRPSSILKYFSGLHLVEFSAITDAGAYIQNADISAFDNARYACGLFLFTKEPKNS